EAAQELDVLAAGAQDLLREKRRQRRLAAAGEAFAPADARGRVVALVQRLQVAARRAVEVLDPPVDRNGVGAGRVHAGKAREEVSRQQDIGVQEDDDIAAGGAGAGVARRGDATPQALRDD